MNRSGFQLAQEDESAAVTRRGLLLRDGVTFLVLSLVTLALYGVTLFLFRSFEGHREELALRWSQRGRTALEQNRPEEAVGALRAALSYAPDESSYYLLLAQALAASGRTEEANSYFLNLHDAMPGDGSINLQLARLARKKGEAQAATDFYRASIFGDWQGDGVTRRRAVRLELADYLTERHDLPAARSELLIAAGNAPDDPKLNVLFGDKLQAAGDLPDALTYYQRAIADDPHRREPLEKAGRAAFALGDYPRAHRLLERALEARGTPGMGAGEVADEDGLAGLARDAGRMVDLSPSRELPARERAAHIEAAAKIAQARLKTCSTKMGADGAAAAAVPGGVAAGAGAGTQPDLAALRARWKSPGGLADRGTLERDATAQDVAAQLIFDTELETEKVCGGAAGDDALLLILARAPHGAGQGAGAGHPADGRPE